MATVYSRKRRQKLLDGKCLLCGEADAAVLDGHRITPGEAGGKYTRQNIVTLCSNCHRKAHAGEVRFDRYYLSTGGWVLRCWVGNEEKWIPASPV